MVWFVDKSSTKTENNTNDFSSLEISYAGHEHACAHIFVYKYRYNHIANKITKFIEL